jgi:hypothetical protein
MSKVKLGIYVSIITLFLLPGIVRAQTTITINPNVTYQTITGWEGSGQIAHNDSTYQFNNYLLWRDTVVDKLVNELGINRIRQTIKTGAENTTDWFAVYRQDPDARLLTDWRPHWY